MRPGSIMPGGRPRADTADPPALGIRTGNVETVTGSRARRAWLVWLLGMLAYTVAVFHRSSLGVTGISAQHRFGAGPALLSVFSVLQLAVYAAMQIPVGVLLDRLGSRRMIVGGALLMAAGQLLLARATAVPGAVVARVLVGAGDAMTFISVLRLVPAWFPARQVPVVTQLTGILGQVGQIVAAYPLVTLLRVTGWTAAFTGAAAAGVVVAGAVAWGLRDAPAGASRGGQHTSWLQLRTNLAATWREPGTRLGLWSHFVTQFPGQAFGLLWGYPFLVVGEGRSPAMASALLSVLVIAGMGVGPGLGLLVGRWPLRRSALVLGVVGSSALVWTLVLGWPGRAPLPLLVLLVIVLGTNGPGSMVGFDYARTANPASRLGSATGIVNVGGFVASLITILGIGLVLQALTPAGSSAYTLGAFRAAFAGQYVVWALGTAGVLRNRRVARRQLAAAGVTVDPLASAIARRWRSRGPVSRSRRVP
jgi:hypothetical protein